MLSRKKLDFPLWPVHVIEALVSAQEPFNTGCGSCAHALWGADADPADPRTEIHLKARPERKPATFDDFERTRAARNLPRFTLMGCAAGVRLAKVSDEYRPLVRCTAWSKLQSSTEVLTMDGVNSTAASVVPPIPD